MRYCVHCDGTLEGGIRILCGTRTKGFIHKECYQQMLNTLWKLAQKAFTKTEIEDGSAND